MKKIVTLLIALVVALSCLPALSEAYEKPILFRGLQWGSSYAQVAEETELQELSSTTPSGTASLLWSGESPSYDTGTGSYAYDKTGTSPKVAGYQTIYVEFYFASLPDENGYLPVDEEGWILADPECTALYAAVYGMYGEDQEEIYEDLVHKLTSLYGEADLSTEEATVWYGAEGTMVSLRKVNYRVRNAVNVSITYACTSGDEWLNAAQDAVDKAFSENTEGL